MIDAPDPPVPPDADLQDFAFMPLDVRRLRDSDLAAIDDAEAFRAAVLSWCVAWHQVPAGSLPDDDAALCRLLGYGRDLKTWRRVREAGALRGWVRHADGRLYHPVVTEKVLTALAAKRSNRRRTEAARRARLNHPTTHVTTSVTDNVTDHATTDATTPVTASKGIDRGIERDITPLTPHTWRCGGTQGPLSNEGQEGQDGQHPEQGDHQRKRGLRANGTNPRAIAAAQAERQADEIRRAMEAHPLWPKTRPWMTEADFRTFIARCEFVEAGETGTAVLLAPSRWLRDHIRCQWADHLKRAIGTPITIDVMPEGARVADQAAGRAGG